MTAYDFAMLGVVIAGMIWGALRGITWQIASIASLVLGYAVSMSGSSQLAPYFPGEPVVARALAMLVLYVAVSGGIYLAAWSIRAILKKWQFEAYDRHLGMVLGGLEGAFLGVVVTLFALSLAPGTRQPILTSPTGHVVGGVLDAVGPALPGEVRTMLAKFWSEPTDRVALRADEDRRPAADPAPTPAPAARDEAPAPPADEVAPDAPATADDAKADPSIVKDLIKEGTDKLGEVLKDPGGPEAKGDKAAIKRLIRKGTRRVGEAVSEILQEELDARTDGKQDGKQDDARTPPGR